MEEYLKPSFEELFAEDGLTVMGRGLGIWNLLYKFVQFYSIPREDKKLVFCLNATENFETMKKILLSEGLNPANLPKLVTNEATSAERSDMYAPGGCFVITSRILIVDILDGKLDPSTICGLLIPNAHRITDVSVESFIVRVFRQKNRTGFIKAFSDEPEGMVSGLCKVERLLKLLFLRRLYLWPRFKVDISKVLNRVQPEVIELSEGLTDNMRGIQSAILVAMKGCMDELKRSAPSLDTTSPHMQLTLENAMVKGFELSLKAQLESDWHRISPKARQLVHDLGQLRKLLDYLLCYDAYSFYSFLLSLKSASSSLSSPSLWLTSEAADHLFQKARERLYKVVPIPESSKDTVWSQLKMSQRLVAVKECPPKWRLLQEVVAEITDCIKTQRSAQRTATRRFDHKHNCIVVFVRDARTTAQVRDILIDGDACVLDQRHRWLVSQLAADVRSKGNMSSSLIRPSSNDQSIYNRGGSSIAQSSGNASAAASLVRDSCSENQDGCSTSDIRSSSSSSSSSSGSSASSGHAESSDYGGLNLSKKQFDYCSLDGKMLLIHELELRKTPASISRGRRKDSKTSERAFEFPADDDDGICIEDAIGDAEQRTDIQEDTTKTVIRKRAFGMSKGSASGSKVQTNSKRHKADAAAAEGLIDYHALMEESERKTQGNDKSFDFVLDEDEEDADAVNHPQASGFLEDQPHIIVLTHSEAARMGDIVHELSPRYVILYDADVELVRSLEVHAATSALPIRIYMLVYEGSSEEHRYVSKLSREKKAFESLISTKANMVISLPDHAEDLAREHLADMEVSMDTRTRAMGSSGLGLGLSSSSSKKGGQRSGNSGVVVDVREFRSSLPSLLHASNFSLIPRTLTVGDFVLSPEICIERKGISDLFSSFASGRLYTQAESMCRYYKYPCLLIEFSSDRPMTLQSASDIHSDGIYTNAISTRLSILALTFPSLRFLWSRSPHATPDIFRHIMLNHEAVDVSKAVSVGAPAAGSEGSADVEEEAERDARAAAVEMLNSLPGVNHLNCRAVMEAADSIAELSRMTEAQLAPVMGPGNARKLVNFFRQRI